MDIIFYLGIMLIILFYILLVKSFFNISIIINVITSISALCTLIYKSYNWHFKAPMKLINCIALCSLYPLVAPAGVCSAGVKQ